MKNYFFTRIWLWWLLYLLIIIAGSDLNKASANEVPRTEKNSPEKVDKLQDPVEYVLGKLQDYDLVMIGEHHWTCEQPVFIQMLIKRCFEKNAINAVFLEFGHFEDQGKIDAFMQSDKYDPKPVIEALRDYGELGWGYQEYFDIFKLIYDENRKRSPAQRIRLILTDPEFESVNLGALFYDCLKLSPIPEKHKWQMVTWLRESIQGRDQRMAAVIEAHVFGSGLKGIYYAGGSHIRKDLRKKDYGLRLFSAGGILARKYPDHVCCLTFHKSPWHWQSAKDFDFLEELFRSYGTRFAIDSSDQRVSRLRLKSQVLSEGVALQEAFDGYIMLNQDKDYHHCAVVPGFYDDEFAKVVWDRLRKDKERFKRLPPELSKWREKTPTGEELTWMIGEYGLR